MKKLFLALYFIPILFMTTQVQAKIHSFADPTEAEQYSKNKKNVPVTAKTSPKYKTLTDLLEDRAGKSIVTAIPDDEVNNSMSQSSVLSPEHAQMMEDKNKSFFQKIYENAVSRATSKEPTYSQNVLQGQGQPQAQQVKNQQETWEKPNYQTVSVSLPTGTKILAPAIEHISYLLTDIDLLSNGAAKISEKVIVVANGEKLKHGLSKALPKFSVSRDGTSNKIDINLISVKIDGQEFDYKIEEIGNTIYFKPKYEYELQPGVYTYDFEYIVNRQLWVYEDFDEFYWNITGNYWNLIIARAGAIIKIPGSDPVLGKAGFIMSFGRADFVNVRTFEMENNAVGVASIGPIFVGESLQTVLSIPKENFLKTQNNTSYRLINDYGDIILSILGLIAIVGGYFVSWIFISNNTKTKKQYSISKTGPILRYLVKNGFDKISFGAFLLELYKKRIINIKQEDGKIYLIKLSDSTSGLSKLEATAIHNLFPNKESYLEVNRNNVLKISRAYKASSMDTKSKIKKFILMTNSGYIGFSILMLLLVQLGTALLSYNPLNNFLFMIVLDSIIAVALTIAMYKTKSFWQYTYKPIAVIAITICLVLFGIIVSTTSAILNVVAIITIFAFTNLFSGQNGLIKNNISEARQLRENLNKNISENSSDRLFSTQQPAIFAFELTETYNESVGDKEDNKLKIVNDIIRNI
ncbi:MAG: DUF2207 domain-containing protein [Alphaproteobacteria bacterium]